MMRCVIALALLCGLARWVSADGIYANYCLQCHGARGDGNGPAAALTWGTPADFTKGSFAWRSGDSASDDDLRMTIRFGVPGTSMPAFALDDAAIDEAVAAVRAFGPATRATPRVRLGAAPAPDAAKGNALWSAKGCNACHGDDGRGVRTWDLTALPMHRPRAGKDVRAAAAMTIAVGAAAMPGYADALSNDEVWWLADRAVELNRGASGHAPMTDDGRKAGTGGMFPIAPQGAVPATLAPAQASLAARQCARCHAKQYREWRGSLHRGAASPGLIAQIDYGMADAVACRRCHAPLAEQSDVALRDDGASCAGCHVRSWTRHGPPNPSAQPIASYPVQVDAAYERAELCLPCHQLPARTALAGRPLLNTYKEWLEGPYAKRGVQCQHCHMPNREHEFKGVHDPETFRQGIQLRAVASHEHDAIVVVAELTNIGAGHMLPTTTTPAAWLRVELLKGKDVVGKFEQRIGRDLVFDGEFHERADTRIAPGEKLTVARSWKVVADRVRVTVEVHPDDYYEGFYRNQLAGKLVPAQRALFGQALAKATAAHYVAEQRVLQIP